MIVFQYMEMVDILNSDGSPSGKRVSKKEAHEKGLWHRTAHVWLVNKNNEILLQKRADHIESNPGMYDISAAGHLSAGDTRVAGALREVEEELGIHINENDLINIGEIRQESTQHNGRYINKEYSDVYVVRSGIPVSGFVIQESEVDHVLYIPTAELKKWVDEKRKDLVMHLEEFRILFRYLEK